MFVSPPPAGGSWTTVHARHQAAQQRETSAGDRGDTWTQQRSRRAPDQAGISLSVTAAGRATYPAPIVRHGMLQPTRSGDPQSRVCWRNRPARREGFNWTRRQRWAISGQDFVNATATEASLAMPDHGRRAVIFDFLRFARRMGRREKTYADQLRRAQRPVTSAPRRDHDPALPAERAGTAADRFQIVNLLADSATGTKAPRHFSIAETPQPGSTITMTVTAATRWAKPHRSKQRTAGHYHTCCGEEALCC